jgi:hypothetical protein
MHIDIHLQDIILWREVRSHSVLKQNKFLNFNFMLPAIPSVANTKASGRITIVSLSVES